MAAVMMTYAVMLPYVHARNGQGLLKKLYKRFAQSLRSRNYAQALCAGLRLPIQAVFRSFWP